MAVRFPTRRALAGMFQHLVREQWPFQGFADHTVSEALYLTDPDGNGLELYVDRPHERWRHQNGQIEMGTDPLDVEDCSQKQRATRRPGPACIRESTSATYTYTSRTWHRQRLFTMTYRAWT